MNRAIKESGAADPQAETKRIYVLLPVRPDSDHQAELFAAATDVLLLSGRVSFDKPGGRAAKEVGRNSILIAGLKCSTTDLMDMGLEGIIVKADRDDSVSTDSLEEYYRWQAQQRADGTWPERWDEPIPEQEAKDAKALLDSQQSERDKRIAKGTTAVSRARKTS